MSARQAVIAIAAHPDDIEFNMGGTLVLLKRNGYETHYFSLASGNCGTRHYNSSTIRSIRRSEARNGARILGADFHPSVSDDLEITYNVELLRAVTAVVREVKPTIVLTHSPEDYMEDHITTSRLAVTATFSRGMPNFKTTPYRAAVEHDVTVYHAMPHGLRDSLRRLIIPGAFVNTTSVQKLKRSALTAHTSQQTWLDASQGISSILLAMESMSIAVGRMSKRFKWAEGWRRHLHLGFCGPDDDPLGAALGKNYAVSRNYERCLGTGAPC
jgi:N-acetylglucosamine malate deacetylase 1